jgi:hypothetical protein
MLNGRNYFFSAVNFARGGYLNYFYFVKNETFKMLQVPSTWRSSSLRFAVTFKRINHSLECAAVLRFLVLPGLASPQPK